ncbi:MAG: prepilin-type N-terminal cleavage/methylation domain-containing protein [Acidobacteria bacterium]|nr:prepilin-type N-terminal cleavage/methylation domain-containing protein [Acidobacteriota bacterium]
MTKNTERGVSLVEMLIVVALAGIILRMAIPALISTRRNFRISGDARDLTSLLVLAKMRGASNFTRTRVYADTAANTTRVEVWNKTSSSWDTEGSDQILQPGISLGFGSLASPPPNTQASIEQAPQCLDGSGTAIANSTCILFNSRGVPIDASGAPTPHVMYITDGNAVYAISVSATGLILTWRSEAASADWQKR